MSATARRVYVDTSVFGGVYDEEFRFGSSRFVEAIRAGAIKAVVSEIVFEEIARAPMHVRTLFDELLPLSESVPITIDALRLRNAYSEAGILTPKWSKDAMHVALATVAECELIASWNFKHLVHFEKIPRYNAVNTLRGFGTIQIFSPLEIVQ